MTRIRRMGVELYAPIKLYSAVMLRKTKTRNLNQLGKNHSPRSSSFKRMILDTSTESWIQTGGSEMVQKGYPPSSIFMALLLMYLKSLESVLDLVRFLNSNPEWLVTLGLRRKIDGKLLYKVPDRSTFYKFANRLGPDKIVGIFSVMVVELMRARVIKRGKGVTRLLNHTGVVLRLQACKES